MERPKIENKPKARKITGEIAYLDEARRMRNGYPTQFTELSDLAIQMYSTDAGVYEQNGIRPEIMDLYDEYDARMSDTEASCIALADKLLALKTENNSLTFIDISVDKPVVDVLRQLQSIRAGELLATDDEQLALESSGEYYPVLDMRKSLADVVGVDLRVWGWNHEKYLFTNQGKEDFDPKRDLLVYPADEKMAQRQLEITFSYRKKQPLHDGSDDFSESVSLMVSESGNTSITSSVYASAYAETGYEGHNHKRLDGIDDGDVAAFGDLVADIVGDSPESIAMRQESRLSELVDKSANETMREVIQELVDVTWPAQADYILSHRPKGSEKSLAEMAKDEKTVDQAIAIVRSYIDEWQSKR